MRKQTSIKEILKHFASFVLSAVLGLAFALAVSKAHDLFAGDSAEQRVFGHLEGLVVHLIWS